MRPNPQRSAYPYALGAVLLWSTVATAFKLALRGQSITQLLLFATITSTLALAILITATHRWAQVFARHNARNLLTSALAGLLNPFLYYLVLFKAYDLLRAQEAQPLNYTWPLVLSLLSVPLLGQRLSPLALAALLISFSGVIIISTQGRPWAFQFANPLGVALALSSSLIWATYWILNLRDSRDPIVKLFMGFAAGTVYVAVFALWRHEAILPSPFSLAAAAYIGLFEMGITFALWLTALRLARDSAAISNLAYLSPFLSLIFIRFILGEHILPSSILGLLLIVAGIAIQAHTSSQSGGEAPPSTDTP